MLKVDNIILLWRVVIPNRVGLSQVKFPPITPKLLFLCRRQEQGCSRSTKRFKEKR